MVKVINVLEKYNEVTWHIVPKNPPLVIRHCSKCNKKMEYYCSEKFRMNGNHTRIDIWLIYKCSKCDKTLKLTIDKGIKPHDISTELFDSYTHNDENLAWDYAFDRDFLRKNDCVIEYKNVMYYVEGLQPQTTWESNLTIHLKSKYFFDLKLSVLLAGVLGISVSKLRRIVEAGLITASPLCDIMKYRIRSDMQLYVKPLKKI